MSEAMTEPTAEPTAEPTIDHCDRLHAYVDGELAEADAAAFEAHLASCTTCIAELPRLLALVCLLGPFAFAGVLKVQSGSPADSLYGVWVHSSGFALSLVVLGFAGQWGLPLMAGVLAGHRFTSTMIGDASLSKRPMRRVIAPLERMGARVEAIDGHAPLTIHGSALHAIAHEPDTPSAQVKSAVLLAGLHAEGTTSVRESAATRDHTERALAAFGGRADVDGLTVSVAGGQPRNLTSHPANDFRPSFSHDGKWIYFTSNRSGERQIWRMPASGGDAAQIGTDSLINVTGVVGSDFNDTLIGRNDSVNDKYGFVDVFLGGKGDDLFLGDNPNGAPDLGTFDVCNGQQGTDLAVIGTCEHEGQMEGEIPFPEG